MIPSQIQIFTKSTNVLFNDGEASLISTISSAARSEANRKSKRKSGITTKWV